MLMSFCRYYWAWAAMVLCLWDAVALCKQQGHDGDLWARARQPAGP